MVSRGPRARCAASEAGARSRAAPTRTSRVGWPCPCQGGACLSLSVALRTSPMTSVRRCLKWCCTMLHSMRTHRRVRVSGALRVGRRCPRPPPGWLVLGWLVPYIYASSAHRFHVPLLPEANDSSRRLNRLMVPSWLTAAAAAAAATTTGLGGPPLNHSLHLPFSWDTLPRYTFCGNGSGPLNEQSVEYISKCVSELKDILLNIIKYSKSFCPCVRV